MSVFHLPPTCVTIKAVADLPLPYGLARRGRVTAIIVRAGMTRREIRQVMGEHLRPAELALVRASMGEPTGHDDLPPDLDGERCYPGQTLVARSDGLPVPYAQRFG